MLDMALSPLAIAFDSDWSHCPCTWLAGEGGLRMTRWSMDGGQCRDGFFEPGAELVVLGFAQARRPRLRCRTRR